MASSVLQTINDVKIIKCSIYSTSVNDPVDISNILHEINYFEDIFSNCITGNILISDSLGLHDKYSWSGEEFLMLEFAKPRGEDVSDSIKKLFKIYSTSRRSKVNDTNENYIINFCSDELLLSQKNRISRTYYNKRISDIVKSIAFEYLKIPQGEFPDNNIEPTFGTYDITIPNLKPFQAINWLASLAVSDVLHKNLKSGATYLFWQTRYGYFFKSILNIFNTKETSYYRGWSNAGYYWYGTKNLDIKSRIGTKNFISSKDRADEAQNIIQYEMEETFNSLDNIRKGIFSNKSIGIDYVSRKITPIKYNYDDYFGNNESNGYLKNNIELYKEENYSILSGAKDRLGKTQNEYEDTILKVFASTTGQNRNHFVKINDPNIKDYNVEYTMPYRIAQFGLLSHNRFKIAITGDHNITVGMIIKVYIPRMDVIPENTVKPLNKFLSGYYLVTAVRHIINIKTNFTTVLEIRKDAYYALPDLRYTDEGLPLANNNDVYRELNKGDVNANK